MEKLHRWKPNFHWKPEDKLLLEYWKDVGGIIYTEVIIGGRGDPHQLPVGSKPRRIDGVRISTPTLHKDFDDIVTFSRKNRSEFESLIRDAVVEVIEVKSKLGRYVLGLAIIGTDLLEMISKPKEILSVIVCKVGDPLLELICQKRDIKVWYLAN